MGQDWSAEARASPARSRYLFRAGLATRNQTHVGPTGIKNRLAVHPACRTPVRSARVAMRAATSVGQRNRHINPDATRKLVGNGSAQMDSSGCVQTSPIYPTNHRTTPLEMTGQNRHHTSNATNANRTPTPESPLEDRTIAGTSVIDCYALPFGPPPCYNVREDFATPDVRLRAHDAGGVVAWPDGAVHARILPLTPADAVGHRVVQLKRHLARLVRAAER